MPGTHFNIRIVSRKNNDSAVAAAAYQSRTTLFNEYRQETEDYSHDAECLVHTEILLPPNAPKAFLDEATLWNSAEQAERQRNAQLARRIVLTLPKEVPREHWVPMVTEYCQEQFVSRGMCVDVAVHYTEPPPNPHAHILLTMRALDEHGQWLPRFHKIPCDDGHGQPVIGANGKPKLRAVPTTDWNNRGNAEHWRTAWAAQQNKYLEKCNRPERADLRSYKRQGIMKVPTVHLGARANALVQKGQYSFLQHLNDDIVQANGLLAGFTKSMKVIADWLEDQRDAIVAHRELTDVKKHPPIKNDLYEWLLLRDSQRMTWRSKVAQLKCHAKDFALISELWKYMQAHGLYSAEAVMAKLNEMEGSANQLRSKTRKAKKRMADISTILEAAETVKRLQPVQNKSRFGFPSQREKYAAQHAEELAAFKKAYAQLMRLNGSTKIDQAALDAERSDLEAEIQRIAPELTALDPDLTMLRKARKCVNAVQRDAEERVSVHEQLTQAHDHTPHQTDHHRNEPMRDAS